MVISRGLRTAAYGTAVMPCEGCAKRPSFGLPAEGRMRWCGTCARAQLGAVSAKTGKPPLPFVKRLSKEERQMEMYAARERDHPEEGQLAAIDAFAWNFAIKVEGVVVKPEPQLPWGRPRQPHTEFVFPLRVLVLGPNDCASKNLGVRGLYGSHQPIAPRVLGRNGRSRRHCDINSANGFWNRNFRFS